MFKDKNVAQEISTLMLDLGTRLETSLAMVEEKCPARESRQYRKVVATLMAEMLLEVMNPLYAEHPELKPKELPAEAVTGR